MKDTFRTDLDVDLGDFEDVSRAITKIPPTRRPAAASAARAQFRGARATGAQSQIYEVLLSSVNWKTGQTTPIGRSDLEAATARDRATVTRGLRWLKSHGFLLSRAHTLHGRNQRNTYAFPHLADFYDATAEVNARNRAGKRLGARKRLIVPMEWILQVKKEKKRKKMQHGGKIS